MPKPLAQNIQAKFFKESKTVYLNMNPCETLDELSEAIGSTYVSVSFRSRPDPFIYNICLYPLTVWMRSFHNGASAAKHSRVQHQNHASAVHARETGIPRIHSKQPAGLRRPLACHHFAAGRRPHLDTRGRSTRTTTRPTTTPHSTTTSGPTTTHVDCRRLDK